MPPMYFIVQLLPQGSSCSGASINFSDGGGGGGKSKENFKIFGALRAQCRNINFARGARRKIENCECFVVFLCLHFCSASYCFLNLYILALHIMIFFFKLSKLFGGGGQNDMFATPIFSPPPPRSTPLLLLVHTHESCLCSWLWYARLVHHTYIYCRDKLILKTYQIFKESTHFVAT